MIFQIVFSSLYEEKGPFTRDYGIIKAELQNIDDYDKTCIETALHGVNQLVLSEWGNNTPCQVSCICIFNNRQRSVEYSCVYNVGMYFIVKYFFNHFINRK